MYFVCVICMVGGSRNPLKELTSERRQLWELIISPRVNVLKLRKCLLLVCSDCNQLLDTMLEFRQTMEIGARNLLALYRNTNVTTVKHLRPVDCHKLPSVIGPQFDVLLPVANEEIVQSTESWSDCEAAESLATKNKTVERPPASPASCVNHKAVDVSEHSIDYAVLIPINEKNSTNLLCEEDVYSSEISETCKFDEAMPMRKGAKEEAIEAKFPIISESSEVKKIKLNRKLFEAIRATLRSPTLTEEFDIKYEPESESEVAIKSAPELARESKLNLERKLAPELERESVFELIRETALKLESASKLKLDPKSARELDRKSTLKLARESALNLEHKSSSELERESTLELIRETALKLERKSKLKLQCKSEVELASELAREAALESALEYIRKSALQLERESKLKLQGKSDVELASGSAPELAREPALKLERESAPKLAPESGHESEPDSESTLSGESNYEDPEMFPNIIFAKSFNGISGEGPGVLGKSLEQEGKVEDLQIHSHIVTNPPSEWPCTWDSCQLQSSSVDEDDPVETPTDMPREVSTCRSKRQSVPRRPKCKLCGRSFGKLMDLWRHYEREHMEPALKCDVCRKECRNETELKFHKTKHRFKNVGVYEESPGRHACAECGARCRGAAGLRAHLRSRGHIHNMLWRFQCDICKRKCPDKRRIADHIQREHLAQEAVKCPMCTASFKSARSLGRHASMHILASMQTDTQTQQRPKRARNTHTYGFEDDIHANGEVTLNTLTDTKKPRKTQKINSDTQTHKQPLKRARNTHTNGFEDDILANREVTLNTLTDTKKPRKTQKINSDTQTHKQPLKRARNTHTNGFEDDILANREVTLNTLTDTKKPRKTQKVNSDTQTHKQPLKRARNTHANRYEEADILPNGEARLDAMSNTKKPRKTHKVSSNHRKVYTLPHTYNEPFDTHTDMDGQTRKRPCNAQKANTNHKKQVYTQNSYNEQFDTHTDMNGSTCKRPRNGQLKNGNRHENTHTGTYRQARNTSTITHTNTEIQTNRQGIHTAFHTYARADNLTNSTESTTRSHTDVQTNRQGQDTAFHTYARADNLTNSTESTTRSHTDIQTNRQGIHTEFHTYARADNLTNSTESTTRSHTDVQTNRQGQDTEFHTYARADNMSSITHSTESTQTKVRKKRRRKCVYAAKRSGRRPPAGRQTNAVAKTTKPKTNLFDMLSSFIL